MRLDGKTALITGGAGDIGLATARRMIAEGARVALVDRDPARVEAAAAALGGQSAGFAADVTKEADVARFAADVVSRFGPVDIFFNNAGIAGTVAPLVNYSEADFSAVMAVNVTGVFLGLKHVVPVMRDGGSVIITSSIAGLRGAANMSAYVASKHAVVGLMRTAAIEFAPRRIRVNAVHPGPVSGAMMSELETGMSKDNPMAARQRMAQQMKLGRYVDPDEIADLVMFLASDDSRMITGSSHVIDAGMTV